MGKHKFLVNGEWRESSHSRVIINPYTNLPLGEVWQASKKDIDDAIAAAVAAFQQTRRLQAYERAEALSYIANQIQSQAEEFARLIAAETGKPIAFSRSEVERSVFTFRIAAEEAKRIEGSVLPLDLAAHSKNRLGITRRFPLGPVSAITPFNFPLNLIAHKVAPAIASGNTVVLKPSSNAPLTALLLGKIIDGSTLPKGATNIIPCSSEEAGQLITDERIKLLSFTGSPTVGWEMKNRAGKKRVVLELGGNAGVIVDKDADLDFAVPRIAAGSYGNAGQSCIAVQRILVHNDVYPEFERRFLKATAETITGDPEIETTVVGPMIDESSATKVEGWIREAVTAGARILIGGGRTGAMLQPTVLVNVKPDMKVSCQEVFAPVVTLERFGEFDEAIQKVNNSEFGLQAGVFSKNIDHIFKAFQELEVGGVIINDYPTYRMDHMPYGGIKDSGFGREGVKYAIEEMTELKLMAINLS
ncbi:MAG: aldehyde dehydrogenase family protein [Bacteroidota bacterium]